MELPGQEEERQPLTDDRIMVSAAFEGSEDIAEARILARQFLQDLREDHGLPVSAWTTGMAELVVSELVTNARKYAPGPVLVTFAQAGDVVEIVVWDTEPGMPVIRAADPQRVGQHGLEIVLAVCQSFEVHREPVGKRVVAEIALGDDPVGDLAGPQRSGSQAHRAGGGAAPPLGPGQTAGHQGDRRPHD
ncbi:ATP-binding protein [Streptomyces puniciscabiei]